MGFEEDFKTLVREASAKMFKNVTDLAEKAGVSQSGLSQMLSGKRKGLQLESVGKILDTIGVSLKGPMEERSKEVCFVDAKIVSSGSLLPPPDSEDYLAVPLVGEVGAGPGMVAQERLESWVLVHRGMPSIALRSNLLAVEIGKNQRSMIPLLHPGDIVLIDLDDWGQNSRYAPPGNIFLVREPGQEGGGKVKRVSVSGKGDSAIISFYSENAQENEPEPYFITQDFEGNLRNAIVGKVVWAWTDLSRK